MRKRIVSVILCSILASSLVIPTMAAGNDDFDLIIGEEGDYYPIVEDVIIVEDDVIIEEPADDVPADEEPGSDEPVIGDISDDSGEEEPTDEVIGEEDLLDDETGEDGETFSEEAVILDDLTEVIVEEVEEDFVAVDELSTKAVIVGFGDFNPGDHEMVIYSEDRPSLKELVSSFPKKIPAVISKDGVRTTEDISVSWFCVGEDYETSEGFYFQFSPKWDDSKYKLTSKLDVSKDAPYIPVSVNPGSGSMDKKAFVSAGKSYIYSDRTASVEETKNYVFNYITGTMGLTSAAACGIMANIQYESGFRTDILGDGGTSYGLCQWHASRFTNLKNYCARNGYNYTTAEGQMHFLQYELSTSYNTIFNYMKGVSNTAAGAYDAGYYWCVRFEIPANKEQKGVIRGNLARDTYWPKYGGGTTPPNPPVYKEYSITYVTYGGENSPFNPAKFTSKSETINLYDASLKGYIFSGWFLENNYQNRVWQIPKGYNKDVVLWAKWTPIKYNIKFYRNGGTKGTVSTKKNVKYGSRVTLPANKYTRSGYTFAGWNTKKDGSGKKYSNKASVRNLTSTNGKTVKLYAQWIKVSNIRYSIKFNGNGATSGSMLRIYKCKYNSWVALRQNHFKRKGYTFVGWNTKKDGSGKDFDEGEMVRRLVKKNNGTITLYAQWEKN